jgi:hypothetical protein
MKRCLICCILLIFWGPPALAGVVLEMEVSGPDGDGVTGSEILYAQGEMARMDPYRGSGKGEMSVVFRDQAMWFVDHEQKKIQKIDKEGMAALSTQLEAIMEQMAQLPPEQRAMMEKMMKGKMPGMSPPPEQRLEKGGGEQVGPYACTLHTLYSDDQKVSDVCLADPTVAADMGEAMAAFQAMSVFAEDLMAVARDLPLAGLVKTPLLELDEMDGFPVRSREYDDSGAIVRESTLKSITPREIDPSVFAIPEGYKIQDLRQLLDQGR